MASSESSTRVSTREALYLVAIISIGVALRLVQLGSRPMWYDEAIAVLVSRQGIFEILRSTLSPVAGSSANVHPPLYFSALWVWIEIFGESPFAARALSVVVSVIVMLVLWRLGKAMSGSRAGLYVVGLYALSPFQLQYGQEARMYVMMSMFLLISTLAMWHLLEEGGWPHWLVLGIATALSVYTQILAVIYLVCLFIIPLLLKRWDRIREVVIAGLLSLLLYLPWMIYLPAQFNRVQGGYWIERPGLLELVQTLVAFNAGLPLERFWLPVGLGLSILVVTLLVMRTYTLIRENAVDEQSLVFVLVLTIGPPGLLFAISQVWPVYIVRGLLASGVIYLFLLALVLETTLIKTFDRGVLAIVALILFVIGSFNHYQYRGFPFAPFEEINKYLEPRVSSNTIILHSNKITMLPAYYYNERLPHAFLGDPPGSGSDTLAIPTQRVIGIRAEPDIATATQASDQVFFVIFTREIDEYQQAGLDLHPAIEYMQDNFMDGSFEVFESVRIYHFVYEDS